jgi:hypothetical protein
MGNVRLYFVVALAACGSSKHNPDAMIVVHDAPPDMKIFMDAPIDAPPSFDLSCLGNTTEPSTAANITVTGNVTEVGAGIPPTFMPLVGATVDVCLGNCTGTTNNPATGTTDSSGNFSDGPWATGSTPQDVYLRLTHTGDRTVMEYPGEPLTGDFSGVPMFTIADAAVGNLALVGCTQNDMNNGMAAIAVTDCMNKPITDTANLTLTITQSGSPVGDTPISLGGVQANFKGTYLVCNVPPSTTTTVGATYKGMTFRSHDVNVVKATTTGAQVRPGI